MSAAEWLFASCMAHLAENAALDPLHVFDFAPDRAGFPYAVIEDPVLQAWDGALTTGRIGTVAIGFRDGGERPARLRLLMGRVEEQMAYLPGDLGGEGWRLAGLSLARSRVARVKGGWIGRAEWSVRIFRAN
ncbi:hypothetical protein [Sphingomonas sp.]|uniref:hypothetical protein n=1 Tax=Sphingomonas sp. TaxID=28214 RepID=UPI003CC5BE32